MHYILYNFYLLAFLLFVAIAAVVVQFSLFFAFFGYIYFYCIQYTIAFVMGLFSLIAFSILLQMHYELWKIESMALKMLMKLVDGMELLAN